jgi:multidrug resistance protein MdtO
MNDRVGHSNQADSGHEGLLAFLKTELAAFPGRGNLVMRSVLSSAVAIVLSMSLQVPFLALSLIVVFFVTQSNVVITRLVGVMLLAGSTLAIAIVILVLKTSFDYPLLRIVITTILFFCSVYAMRIVKFGVVFFLIAIVVVYVQTFVDLTDNAEALVRACLWVWVAVNYAVALALLVNTVLLPAEPNLQLIAVMRMQLVAVDARLAALIQGDASGTRIDAAALQRGAAALQKLLKFTSMRDEARKSHDAYRLACATTVSRLHRAAAGLPDPGTDGQGRWADELEVIRADCGLLGTAIVGGQPFVMNRPVRRTLPGGSPAAVQEMQHALDALADTPRSESTVQAAAGDSVVAPDAFTNPVYARFALRTLLAVLLCYLFYNAVRWPGIHTIMLTCLIVALPSLGASYRHGVLRVTGAAVGSALALFAVVFVVPHLDSIIGLLMMSLPVIALGAWISAGSERISYAGVQIMFTFSLALLEQFAPPSDLTEIRDRIVGILLGVGISTFIQMSVWPEGEADVLRQKLAATLLAVVASMRRHVQALEEIHPLPAERSLQPWAALADCESMLTRVAVEPDWKEGEQNRITTRAQTVFAQSRSLLLACNVFEDELRASFDELDTTSRHEVANFESRAIACVERYADQLRHNPPAAQQPPMIAVEMAGSSQIEGVPGGLDATSLTTPGRNAPLFGPLLTAAESLAREIRGLPEWRATSSTWAVPLTQSEQGSKP